MHRLHWLHATAIMPAAFMPFGSFQHIACHAVNK
jgi:hypothetical protein